MKFAFLLSALLATASAAYAQDIAGDPVAGERVFNSCKACHAIGEGAANRVGPQLNELFGRVPGSVPDYSYSEPLLEFGKTHVWDSATLADYIAAPRQVVPGTKMAFGGLKDQQRLADLLAYLAQFDTEGAGLEGAAEASPPSQ